MIFDVIFSLGFTIIRFIFGLIGVFEIPVDLVSVLYSLLCYGTWVVGSDVLLIVTGCISFWIGTRLSVGFAVWLWQQITAIT